MAPRFDQLKPLESSRRPLLELNEGQRMPTAGKKDEAGRAEAMMRPETVRRVDSSEPQDCYLSDLFALLSSVIASKPSERMRVCEGGSSVYAFSPKIIIIMCALLT